MTSRHIISVSSIIALLTGPAAVAASDERDGVEHSVAVSIQADPKVETGTEPLRGTMTLVLRISAHSQTADFAGDVSERFENIDVNRGALFHTVWAQDHCHERRGLPRIWIQRLSGSISEGAKKTEILAEPRHLGMLLPTDELKTEQQVETRDEAGQSERILRARTSKSHFLIEVKLTTTACAR